MWSSTGLDAPPYRGPEVLRSADELSGSISRRLLYMEDGAGCVGHLWFFVGVDDWYRGKGIGVGYVHDMVVRAGARGQGVLRLLVDWARTVLPDGERLHCSDEGLTVEGAPVALHLGLITAEDYDAGRRRRAYTELGGRASGHLGHDGASRPETRQPVAREGTPI